MILALDMGNEQELREYAHDYEAYAHQPLHQWIGAAFRGYLAVLDGDVTGGIAAIQGAAEHTRDGPAAPGQHAILCRILLAARLVSGDGPAALAAADLLLDAGGSACVWAPVARRVRTELGQRG